MNAPLLKPWYKGAATGIARYPFIGLGPSQDKRVIKLGGLF